MKPRLLSKRQAARLQFRNGKLLPTSRDVYSTAVTQYQRFLVQNRLSGEFCIENIMKWLSQYNNTYTYNVRLVGIREWYYKQYEHSASAQRLKVRESFETLRRIKPSLAKLQSIDFLTVEQYQKLVKVVTERIGCLISALFYSGCRISELLNVRLCDCTMGRDGEVIIWVVGKGNKGRHTFIPRFIYKQIIEVFQGEEFLFETEEHRHMSRVYVSNEVRRQSRNKFGISVHPHMLRHSAAMYMKDKMNLSPDQIARALGHASIIPVLAFYFHGIPTARDRGITFHKYKRNKRSNDEYTIKEA